MASHIKKCVSCGNYTLEDQCSCGSKTELPKPPKFSLTDKYEEYRREIKKEDLRKRELY